MLCETGGRKIIDFIKAGGQTEKVIRWTHHVRPVVCIRKEINQIKFTLGIIIIIIIRSMRHRTANGKLDARACRRIDFRLEITTIYDFPFMRDRNCPHLVYVQCVWPIRFGDKTVWSCGWLFRHPLNISSRKTSQKKRREKKQNTIAVTLEVLRTTQSNWQFQFKYIFICARAILNLSLGFRFALLSVTKAIQPSNELTLRRCEWEKKKVHYFIVILLSKCEHIHTAAIRMHAKCWMRVFFDRFDTSSLTRSAHIITIDTFSATFIRNAEENGIISRFKSILHCTTWQSRAQRNPIQQRSTRVLGCRM